MANTNMVFNSFRMNMDRPQHAKVNGYLANFNKTICGSKNQLIIDSIEYYVENYGKEKILKKEEETNRIYVTVEDLEQLRAELFEAAMTEARREVIRVLGTAISGRYVQEKAPEDVAEPEKEEDDEVVSGLASSWMPEM